MICSRGATSTQAIEAFTTGFDQLSNATINPAQQQAIVDYYTNQFAPLKKAAGEEVDIDAVLPPRFSAIAVGVGIMLAYIWGANVGGLFTALGLSSIVWYASRRAGLHLDEAEDEFATPERVQTCLRIIGPTLRLNQRGQDDLLTRVSLTRYGADEYIQYAGQIPKRMTFIVNGKVRLAATDSAGGIIPVRTLESGDFLGQTALTLEPVRAAAYALNEVTVLTIDREVVEDLVSRNPVLLQDFGRAIEERRESLRRALAAAGD